MEEIQQAANTGEVAELQTSTETQQSAETGGTGEQTNVTQTQVFAHRLKEETAKAEARARDAVIAEQYGESHGIRTYAEYQAAVQREQEKAERERMEDAGLDPDLIRSVIDKHPDIQFAREYRTKQEQDAKFQTEAKELFAEFPDLKPEQIPAEVWKIQQDKGLSLLDAYLRVSYKNLAQLKEQEAIQKLTDNAQSTPGALGQGGEPPKTDVKNMPKKDFEDMIARVKRGEQITL